MSKSITETLKKINTELTGSAMLSIVSSLLILSIFLGVKTIFAASNNSTSKNIDYVASGFKGTDIFEIQKDPSAKVYSSRYIYASKRGKKYYYYNCKSTIKESNKIYFNTDAEAQKAGYTLSKTCK